MIQEPVGSWIENTQKLTKVAQIEFLLLQYETSLTPFDQGPSSSQCALISTRRLEQAFQIPVFKCQIQGPKYQPLSKQRLYLFCSKRALPWKAANKDQNTLTRKKKDVLFINTFLPAKNMYIYNFFCVFKMNMTFYLSNLSTRELSQPQRKGKKNKSMTCNFKVFTVLVQFQISFQNPTSRIFPTQPFN